MPDSDSLSGGGSRDGRDVRSFGLGRGSVVGSVCVSFGVAMYAVMRRVDRIDGNRPPLRLFIPALAAGIVWLLAIAFDWTLIWSRLALLWGPW